MEQKQEKFSTIGYIAAALGMCIGTGNVWRFHECVRQTVVEHLS